MAWKFMHRAGRENAFTGTTKSSRRERRAEAVELKRAEE
jgi:hypothetical protein